VEAPPSTDPLEPLHENIGRGTGMAELMPICPTSTSFSNLRAVAPDWVKMAVPLPYLLRLMRAIASSRVSTLTMVRTGPKISSLFDRDERQQGREVTEERGNAPVAVHLRRRFQDRRTDEVSLLVAGNGGVATVEENLSALVGAGLDETFDAVLGLRRNDGTASRGRGSVRMRRERRWTNEHLDTGVKAVSNLEGFRALNELVDPVLRVTDGNECRESHAALSSSTKSGSDDSVESKVFVSVGKNNAVVLCPEVGLNTLSVLRTGFVDVLTRLVAADECDGLESGWSKGKDRKVSFEAKGGKERRRRLPPRTLKEGTGRAERDRKEKRESAP
jgi:hypothetical protein